MDLLSKLPYNHYVNLIILYMEQNNQGLDSDLAGEYQHIKSDLRKVIIGNLVFLALLIGLYFVDKQYGVLSQLEKLL